ncbi:MAG: B12-binding domain-containing radical SAM protein [Salibacteraceae bacterium]
MAKILFSHSYYYKLDPKQWKTGMPYPPLGTIYAASLMRENGYEVSLFDVCLKDNPFEIEAILHEEKPEFLVLYDDGFNYLTKMCLTNMREAAFEMMQLAKKYHCKIIVASSDSTDHFDQYLQNGADVILLGEGEISLLETVKALEKGSDLQDVSGICFSSETVINTGKRPVLKDLDSLPQPAWDLIEIEAYKSIWKQHGHEFTINMATTRGCPYHCNWCAKPIYGQRYNVRSPKKVVQEMLWIKSNFGVTKYWMCDDIFGLKPGWVQKFDAELKNANLTIRYKIQSRADLLLKENNIDALVSSGLEEVWIGAESGSQKVLDDMDKGTTIAQIAESTSLLQSKKVQVAYFLQFGYLGETKEDIDATISMLLKNMPDHIGVSVSYPLPGTPFYDKVKNQLSNKANWTDSDELALMFQNTFNQDYYKLLHRYVHKVYRLAHAKKWVKKHNPISSTGAKMVLKILAYTPLAIAMKMQLNRLSNLN